MRSAIETRKQLIRHTGGNPFRLDFEAYLALLAADIGALPRLWRHPFLWREVLFGPPIAAQYRLDGHGRRPDLARDILRAKPERAAR
jgi:hypothetical protein